MTSATSISIDRRGFVKALTARAPDALFVSGLGAPTYDLAAAGDTPRNFYLWGAMGGAAPMALGLALAQPDRRVIVVTGDGEMLMGLGALATVAARRPANLAIAVIDNEAFGETGAQTGLTSRGVDLAGVARAAGFATVVAAHRDGDAPTALDALADAAGPVFALVKTSLDEAPRVIPMRDGVLQAARFRTHLGIDFDV